MIPRKVVQEEAPSVPIWILSFGDMITNLLAFFILLQSFSRVQKAEVCQVGDAPVTASLTDFGGPKWLFGKRQSPESRHRQQKYPTVADPGSDDMERIIDAEGERIRELFDGLRRDVETRSADAPKGMTRLFPTPIVFAPGQATLDAGATAFLNTLAAELGQSPALDRLTVYVIGSAADAPDTKAQFVLSAQRAGAVREHLARLPALDVVAAQARLLAWGTGARTGALGGTTVAARPPSIVIAVFEPL